VSDPHNLQRFIDAQEPSYRDALAEIRAGRKRSHWMWYVFPQFAGLGNSPMSARYAIRSKDEARAYLAHPILGARLMECAEAVLAINDRSARDIFGTPDDLKLRSSATLFAQLSPPGSVFERLLDKYYSSEPDPKTINLLATSTVNASDGDE
jgi:uncharacterized protein (DUF1810 family)